ncbi:hypothetical protein LTR08_000566 [Meristemomyces frigidus]|nr:hypothetical protein LTR08_000566 [Meristemomyces frigidus]
MAALIESAATPTATPFRIRDLAPELRNHIYDCVFEDDAPHKLSLLEAHAVAPPSAITAVSRQLRQETLELHQHAMAAFWGSHDFCIAFDCEKHEVGKMKKMLLGRCKKLPVIGLRRLNIVFGKSFSFFIAGSLHILVELNTDGSVNWRYWFSCDCVDTCMHCEKSDDPKSEATALPALAMGKLAEAKGLSFATSAPTAGLDVSDCVIGVTSFWTGTR